MQPTFLAAKTVGHLCKRVAFANGNRGLLYMSIFVILKIGVIILVCTYKTISICDCGISVGQITPSLGYPSGSFNIYLLENQYFLIISLH